jgi:hypothetical protein
MVVLDGNFAVGCEPRTYYHLIHTFLCMLERIYAITKEVLEPITFVLTYPTLYTFEVRFEQMRSHLHDEELGQWVTPFFLVLCSHLSTFLLLLFPHFLRQHDIPAVCSVRTLNCQSCNM